MNTHSDGPTFFPEKTGIDYRPELITQLNAPALGNSTSTAHSDPWVAADATETVGNNADAYVDLNAPDGYTPPGDFRAHISAPGLFDWAYDTSKTPKSSQDQQMGAITQLFYNVNYYHDWYYLAGFD